MRKITTALTAAALALGMLVQAIPAGAVVGYDSQFNSESAFVNINPGQTQNFQVFFINTGTTTWTRGTSTQVDLAACLEDKTTCNAQDASEAGWNTNWLSAIRYATTVNTSVAPGAVGTFSYNITAPVGAANGIYRFNGDLVLSTTGEKIHPEGYYQEANLGGVASGAATITSLTPSSGTTAGGTNVVIAGSGIQCTPAFPSVSFGGTAAAVSSCGSTSVTAVSPAHAAGAVTVTVTNSGAAASNGLVFTYTDSTAPTYTAIAVAGNQATVTFSEPVCEVVVGDAFDDFTVTVNSVAAAFLADFLADCNATNSNGVTSFNMTLSVTPAPGAVIEATLTSGADIRDVANNAANAPQTRTTTAVPAETTAPTIVSASAAAASNQLIITFSEPVYCFNADEAGEISVTTGSTTLTSTADNCGATSNLAMTQITYTMTGNFVSQASYAGTSVLNVSENDELQDVVGNDLAENTTFSFVAGAQDFTPPTLTDTRVTANPAISTNFDDSGDAFQRSESTRLNSSHSSPSRMPSSA